MYRRQIAGVREIKKRVGTDEAVGVPVQDVPPEREHGILCCCVFRHLWSRPSIDVESLDEREKRSHRDATDSRRSVRCNIPAAHPDPRWWADDRRVLLEVMSRYQTASFLACPRQCCAKITSVEEVGALGGHIGKTGRERLVRHHIAALERCAVRPVMGRRCLSVPAVDYVMGVFEVVPGCLGYLESVSQDVDRCDE